MRGGELASSDSSTWRVSRRVRPVQQHPSQTGDDAGHSELLMQEVSSAEDSADGNGSGSRRPRRSRFMVRGFGHHHGRCERIVVRHHSRLACRSRACMVFRAVSRLLPSEVLGRIIVTGRPRIPTMTSQTRDWR